MTNKLSFPYGGNFAEVAVNVRTGEVRLDKFLCFARDCGTPINPELAEGLFLRRQSARHWPYLIRGNRI